MLVTAKSVLATVILALTLLALELPLLSRWRAYSSTVPVLVTGCGHCDARPRHNGGTLVLPQLLLVLRNSVLA